MNKLYTILKPNNPLYNKTQKRLKTIVFNCEICETKCAALNESSIVTKDISTGFIHVLNYCPKCLQRFPIQFNLIDNSISVAWPSWDGKDEDGIYPRRMG